MIVPVTLENEEAWAEMCVALWPDETREHMCNERARGELPAEFLYLLGGEPVGFCSLSLRHEYVEGTEGSPVGYLEGIYVRPEHRRRGIARELVEYARKWSRENGCTVLASDCELDNKESEAFHRSLGFVVANRLICFTMDLENH